MHGSLWSQHNGAIAPTETTPTDMQGLSLLRVKVYYDEPLYSSNQVRSCAESDVLAN